MLNRLLKPIGVAGVAAVAAALVFAFHRSEGTRVAHRDGQIRDVAGSSSGNAPAAVVKAGGLNTAQSSAVDQKKSLRLSAAWDRKFRSASDYYQFIKDAEGPARNGNGRASYYIAKALLDCAPYVNRYRDDADPEAAFEEDQTARIKDPQWYRDVVARTFRECRNLIHGNVFADLPQHPGGYPITYWYDQAGADRDPVAVMDHTASRIASLYGGPASGKAEATQAQMQENIRQTINSGDPHAIFLAGMLLANGSYSAQPLRGVGIALAACDMGYDCSAANPDNPFSLCAKTGACPADANFAYYMQRSLGSAEYATAYSDKLEFEAMLSRNDTAGIDQVTELRAYGTTGR